MIQSLAVSWLAASVCGIRDIWNKRNKIVWYIQSLRQDKAAPRLGVSRQQPTSYKHFCYAATFMIRTKSEGASSYMENFNPSRKPHQLKSHAGPSLRQKSCRTLLWKRDKSLWCIGIKYFNSKYLTKSHKAAKNILILAVTKESHKVLILPHSLTCWNVHKQDYLWDSGCVILCNLLVTQILTTSRTETL